MRKHFLLSSILIGFTLSGYSQELCTTKSVQHYTTKKYDCAVFPADFDGTTRDNLFTPSFDQVSMAEKAMHKKLKGTPNLHPILVKYVSKHLKDYKRQYFGYVDHRGHHILYINCFTSDAGDYTEDMTGDWLSQKVNSNRVGANCWQTRFDLDEGQFVRVDFLDAGSGI
jgi:hypothetical protein